uniref:Uncharacterized protein n=1 Tax=viral metagenome TaxID=1070528 RepID=A0A6C0IA29_9ZZZZ
MTESLEQLTKKQLLSRVRVKDTGYTKKQVQSWTKDRIIDFLLNDKEKQSPVRTVDDIKKSPKLNKDVKYKILKKFYENQIKDLLFAVNLDISSMYNEELQNNLHLKRIFPSYPTKISIDTKELYYNLNNQDTVEAVNELFYSCVKPKNNEFLKMDIFKLWCTSDGFESDNSIFHSNDISYKFGQYVYELNILKNKLNRLRSS